MNEILKKMEADQLIIADLTRENQTYQKNKNEPDSKLGQVMLLYITQ